MPAEVAPAKQTPTSGASEPFDLHAAVRANLEPEGEPKAEGEGQKTDEELAAEAEAAAANEGKTAEEIEAERVAAEEAANEGKTAEEIEAERVAAEEAAAAPHTFTPEQEELVTTRVTEATAELQTQLEAALQEVQTLRQAKVQVVSADVHPLMLAAGPADLDRWENRYLAFERWANKNWDGFQGDEAKGEQTWTAQEIRERMTELRQEREKVLPMARGLLRERAVADAEAKKFYPDLFKPTSKEFKTAQGFIAAVPALRQFPDIMIMMGDALVGEKIRLAKNKPAAAATKPGAKPAAPAKAAAPIAKAPAPKVPGAAKPAARSPIAPKTAAKSTGPDVKAFVKAGGSRSALVAAIRGSGAV